MLRRQSIVNHTTHHYPPRWAASNVPSSPSNHSTRNGKRVGSQSLAFLRIIGAAVGDIEVAGKTGDEFERPGQTPLFFAQDDLISSSKNLDFLSLKPELLGQSNRLTIARAKYLHGCHFSYPSVPTRSVYADNNGRQLKL